MEGYYNPASRNIDNYYTFPSLLSALRDKPESLLYPSTINLLYDVLSGDNYMYHVTRLDHVSDAENLLNLMRHWLQKHSPSNQDADINGRARQFMLAVISRMYDVLLPNMPHHHDSYMLPLLLTILGNKLEFKSIDYDIGTYLVRVVLSREDHIALTSQLNQFSEAINLLRLLEPMLGRYSLPNHNSATIDMSQQARQLMLAVISKMCGEPQSNILYDPHNNMLPSLFYILNNVELGYPLATNGLAVNLMTEILSEEEDIWLQHNSETRNLSYFIQCRLRYHQNSDNADLKGRANQFILEVTAKIQGISLSNSNTPYNLHSEIFQMIIAILDPEEMNPFIEELIENALKGLIYEILSQKDIDIVALQLDQTTADATNLLKFVLDFILFRDFDSPDITQQARLFLLKIMSKTCIEPQPNADDPESYSFPLLLYILNDYVCDLWYLWLDGSITHSVMIDLVCHILSGEDYIKPVAQLDKVSDAKNLLDFLLEMLQFDVPFSNQNSSMAVDMVQRGRQVMLEVFSKMHIVPSFKNMPYDPDDYALPLLLYILKDSKDIKYFYPTALETMIINLVCMIISQEDYIHLVTQIDNPSDAGELLDLILNMLLNHHILSQDSTMPDISARRARRFMLKIISKIPIIPPSLIVTGVNIPVDRDYIGGGGFGHVFKGERRGKVVALKVLYKSDNQVAFCREALMWQSLNHKFVLPFLGIHEITNTTVPQFFLVSPYMKNGTLSRWRKKANPPIAVIEERILEVAQAMEYIHSEGAFHGDLRGENVLLDDNFHVQVADFGLTRLSEATNTRSGALHLNFAAPELFGISEDDDDPSNDPSPRTQMSDVYAFGCVFYEIYYDSIPFAGKTDMQILTLVSRGVLPPKLEEQPLSDGAWDVIQRCWAREPLKRPRMNNVVESMTAMSQSVSPQINAEDESLREELPSSSTPDSTASQKRKRAHDEPDNHDIASTSGITSESPDRKRRRQDSGGEQSLLPAIE